jgi:hypothetical protein
LVRLKSKLVLMEHQRLIYSQDEINANPANIPSLCLKLLKKQK